MRVVLLHNPSSGRQRYSRQDLLKLFHKAGFEPEYYSTKEVDLDEILRSNCDFVIVAGGDGTVDKIGTHLQRSNIPMAILPLGTANNISHTLGSNKSVPEIIEGLSKASPIGFDVGSVEGPWGKAPFFEGIGIGLFSHVMNVQEIRRSEGRLEDGDEHSELQNDLLSLKEQVGTFPSINLGITLDGRDLSGRYLMVEIMNTGYVGPHLRLAPEAEVGDGEFDVVLVSEEQRLSFAEYLENRLEGNHEGADLPVICGRHVRLSLIDQNASWEQLAIHIDGKSWPRKEPHGVDDTDTESDSQTIDISIQKHALKFLVSN